MRLPLQPRNIGYLLTKEMADTYIIQTWVQLQVRLHSTQALKMVVRLIKSLLACEEVAQIIVTLNIPEALAIPDCDLVRGIPPTQLLFCGPEFG